MILNAIDARRRYAARSKNLLILAHIQRIFARLLRRNFIVVDHLLVTKRRPNAACRKPAPLKLVLEEAGRQVQARIRVDHNRRPVRQVRIRQPPVGQPILATLGFELQQIVQLGADAALKVLDDGRGLLEFVGRQQRFDGSQVLLERVVQLGQRQVWQVVGIGRRHGGGERALRCQRNHRLLLDGQLPPRTDADHLGICVEFRWRRFAHYV